MRINQSSQSVAAVKRISLSVKKTFLAAMSEDDFRDRVVHPLFVEKGMDFGKDVCGIDEQGKDCYFWVQHPVVGRTLTVVQTKRGKLNLARIPKENVEEAATQIRTAIAIKISNPANGAEVLPSSAILVASGEINTSARQHITSLEIEEIKVQDILTHRDSLFLMTGEAGAGKTTSLRRLAMIAIDRALDKPDSIAGLRSLANRRRRRPFELSQNLRAKWFAADWAAKRRVLEIVCLNWTLDGVSLVPKWRKPFDLLAEGLRKKDSRGDTI